MDIITRISLKSALIPGTRAKGVSLVEVLETQEHYDVLMHYWMSSDDRYTCMLGFSTSFYDIFHKQYCLVGAAHSRG